MSLSDWPDEDLLLHVQNRLESLDPDFDKTSGVFDNFFGKSKFSPVTKTLPAPKNHPFSMGPILSDEGDEDEDDERDLSHGFEFVVRPLALNKGDLSIPEDDLIGKWKQTKDADLLENILARNQDFLRNQMQGYAGFRLPRGAIAGAVTNTFVSALANHDPTKSNIRTYYKSDHGLNLAKQMRQMAQFAKVDKTRASKIERVRQLQQQLEAEAERQVSDKEIFEAGRGSISLKDIGLIRREDRGDLLGSKNLSAEDDYDKDQLLKHAILRTRELYNGRHQQALDHFFGLHNKEQLESKREVAKRVGMPESSLGLLLQRFNTDLQIELSRLESRAQG